MKAVAKQRRAEVDRARQFFREPQSFEGRKAQLDKLKQKLPCTLCGQMGHWNDDNGCQLEEDLQPLYHTRENSVQPQAP